MVFIINMERSSCTRHTLALGDFAVVEQCSCGSVHVTIGAVTLRLAACSIGPLASTMEEAARRLAYETSRECGLDQVLS